MAGDSLSAPALLPEPKTLVVMASGLVLAMLATLRDQLAGDAVGVLFTSVGREMLASVGRG